MRSARRSSTSAAAELPMAPRCRTAPSGARAAPRRRPRSGRSRRARRRGTVRSRPSASSRARLEPARRSAVVSYRVRSPAARSAWSSAKPVGPGRALAPGPEHPPVAAAKVRPGRTTPRRAPPPRSAGSPNALPASASARIASPFHAVEDLVVGARVDPAARSFEQDLSCPVDAPRGAPDRRSRRGRHRTFVPSQLPSGWAPSARATGSPTSSTSSSQLPHEELAPRPPRSRRPARRRTPRRVPHLAQEVVERPLRHVAGTAARGSAATRRVYSQRELRVVVQHLLEVRHVPAPRRSNTGRSHRRPDRGCRRRPSGRASSSRSPARLRSPADRPHEQNSRVIGCGNFGRAAEAAPSGLVERGSEAPRTTSSSRASRAAGPSRSAGPARRSRLLPAACVHLVAVAPATPRRCPPGPGRTRHAARGARGKYVPAKNGRPPGVRNTDIGQPPWPCSSPGPRPCRSRPRRGVPPGRP